MKAVENSYREPIKELIPNPYEPEIENFKEQRSFHQIENFLRHIEKNFDISKPFKIVEI